MTRIATIVGARPQFIKAAVVSRALEKQGVIDEDLIHTGQHYDQKMSDIFFAELEIPPPRLSLGVGSGSHATQTARMLEAIERALVELEPRLVLLYGDTNSTLAGAMVASKLRIPVAHVEAGLRSFVRDMPEEINRIVADHVSDLLFPPTTGAEARLLAEGLGDRRIVRVGDVMYDATLHARRQVENRPSPVVTEFATHGYALATIHRAENTDDPARLATILAALAEVSKELPVIFPLHPRTRAAAGNLAVTRGAKLRIIEPVGYLEMQQLEAAARLVVTDSGGVQKEAYWHGVPCVTLRAETEWTELVDSGWNTLVRPVSPEAIVAEIRSALAARRGQRPHFYGDGTAGERIAVELASFLEQAPTA